MNGPDVGRDGERSARIRNLRDRVQRGDYRVPAEAVADAVIAWYRRTEPITRR